MDHLRQQAAEFGETEIRESVSEEFGSQVVHQRKRSGKNLCLDNRVCLDNRYVLDYQKQLISLNLNGVETSTNAQTAQVEGSPVIKRGART